MNQFRLDLDSKRCAQAHQDAHCGKMLCELMQQACTAFPEPRSTRLRFSDTGACAPPDRAAVDLWLAACVAAYRDYYRAEKRGYWRKSRDPAKPSTWVPAKWTRRNPPEWF